MGVVYSYRSKIKYYLWAKTGKIAHAHRRFNKIYQSVNGAQLSKQDREALKIDAYEWVYGEIDFLSFAKLLNIAEAKPEEIFYDIGSGVGKAVIAAALLADFKKCCGIEYLPSLHKTSLKCQKKLNASIEFAQANFLDVDISEADIIFVNATGFFAEFWQAVEHKLMTLKPGTRIILTSKSLPETNFQLNFEQFMPMSWGMSLVRIYVILPKLF